MFSTEITADVQVITSGATVVMLFFSLYLCCNSDMDWLLASPSGYYINLNSLSCPAVNRIKTETGTSIIIPPDEEKSDVIRIEGDPKGVAAAKTMLLEMAAKMASLPVCR